MNPRAKLPFAHMWLSLLSLRTFPCICSVPEKKQSKKKKKQNLLFDRSIFHHAAAVAASYDKATLLVMQQ